MELIEKSNKGTSKQTDQQETNAANIIINKSEIRHVMYTEVNQ